MNNMDWNLIIEMIVEEGYKRYNETQQGDKDLVRSIYSVWCDLSLLMGPIYRDSRPNVKGGI